MVGDSVDGANATTHDTAVDPDVVAWLMQGDPVIRWQTMRDLVGEPRDVWEGERRLVSTEGWGAQLLSVQNARGEWTPKLYGHKWISTTYSMVLLRRFGLEPRDPRALRACGLLLDDEALWKSDLCIAGMVLALVSWFGVDDPRCDDIAEFVLQHQFDDGGWNCRFDRGTTHSSLHTTANVVEGLREYADADGALRCDTQQAEADAQQFLLAHRLYRSHTDGVVIDARMTRLSFPPRWRHDVLRSLDYFRAADGAADERLGDAIRILAKKRLPDGRWPLQQRYAGRTWFEMEQVGQPSRWNTLRALRVLAWWNQNNPDLARRPPI